MIDATEDEDVPFSPESARASYEALKQRIDAVPASVLTRIRSPLIPMLSTVSAVAAFVQQPEQRARFAAMPDFDVGHVDDLHLMPGAYWYTTIQRRKLRAGATGASVDPDLIDRANGLKTRMFTLLDYHLGGLPLVRRELDEIRSGQGYEDLGSDLVRLADVHEAYDEEIADDRRNYVKGDAPAARSVAMQIFAQLTDPKQPQHSWDLAQRRCAALLDHAYREILSAAGYLYRNDPAAAERFPSLHSVGRTRPSVSRAPSTPAPAPSQDTTPVPVPSQDANEAKQPTG